MNDLLFFDTGVLLCAYDASDPERQRAALGPLELAMQSGCVVISTQVMHEFYQLSIGRRLLSAPQALTVLQQLARLRVVGNDAQIVMRAAKLQQRVGFAMGEATIVQAALEAQCRVLYSDSLGPGLCFESPNGGPALHVVDPLQPGFGTTLQERRARYGAAPQAIELSD